MTDSMLTTRTRVVSMLLSVGLLALLQPSGARAASLWTVGLVAGSHAQAKSEAAPAAPASVTATCNGGAAGKPTISWAAVNHASTYDVYQAAAVGTLGTYQFVATVNAPTTNWTMGSNLALDTYSWKVLARVGNNWTSPQSGASNQLLISMVVVTLTCTNLG